jgi:hypothetical protein
LLVVLGGSKMDVGKSYPRVCVARLQHEHVAIEVHRACSAYQTRALFAADALLRAHYNA